MTSPVGRARRGSFRSLLRAVAAFLARPAVVAVMRDEGIYRRLAWLEARLDRQEGQQPRFTADTAEHERRLRTLLGRIRIEEPVGGRFERIGGPADGGYVMETSTLRPSIAYSLGIGDDVSWDLEMARRGFEVFQYDHSVAAPPHIDPRFHFRRLRIGAGRAGTGGTASLDRLLLDNGHAERDDLVLKMDIEGGEWEVLEAIPPGALLAFRQVVIEFHDLWRVDRQSDYDRALAALDRLVAGFVPVHVHGNNNSPVTVVGGVALPQVLELTCLRRDLIATRPNTRSFPTEIDRPNRPDRADIYLGRFEF